MIFSVVPKDEFRRSVLEVFVEALKRLAARAKHERAEDYINHELFWLTQEVRVAFKTANKPIFPFVVVADSNNQPEPSDDARANRLKKRPDFACVATDDQATDPNYFQIKYYLECKRLGTKEGSWVLNDNYSKHGIDRFAHKDWGYGKGCPNATMIGYMQNMPPADVLSEVNSHLPGRSFPVIKDNPGGWSVKDVTELAQDAFARQFDTTTIELNHLWVDLRHCTFPALKKKKAKAALAAAKKPKAKAAKAPQGKKAAKPKTTP